MSRSRRNNKIYSAWSTEFAGLDRSKVGKSKNGRVRGGAKRTMLKAGGVVVGVILLLTLIAQLVAMSQFSTLGYEIEALQKRKSDLIQQNSDLRAAIASNQTTEYYQKKAKELGMERTTNITFLNVDDQAVADNLEPR